MITKPELKKTVNEEEVNNGSVSNENQESKKKMISVLKFSKFRNESCECIHWWFKMLKKLKRKASIPLKKDWKILKKFDHFIPNQNGNGSADYSYLTLNVTQNPEKKSVIGGAIHIRPLRLFLYVK